MRPFGLNKSRFWDWEETIEDALGDVLWSDRLRILLTMLKVALKALLRAKKGTVAPSEWRRRMKVCAKCPIYSKANRRCRPFRGSILGCGCYMPYAAIVKERCWADENIPEEGLGWEGHLKDGSPGRS